MRESSCSEIISGKILAQQDAVLPIPNWQCPLPIICSGPKSRRRIPSLTPRERPVMFSSWLLETASFYTFPFCRSTAHIPDCVRRMTRTPFVAFQPVVSLGTDPLLTMDALKARITQTRSVDVVALGSVLAVTLLHALEAKCPHWTLLLTPTKKHQGLSIR